MRSTTIYAILSGLVLFTFAALPTYAQTPRAALQLTVAADQKAVSTPGTLTYTVIVTNSGSVAAQNLKLADTLPAGFTYVDPNIHQELATLGSLGAGESLSKSVKAQVPASVVAGRYEYEVIASADNADSIQSFVGVDVTAGKVLGASTTLAETGASLLSRLVFVSGVVAIALGLIFRQYKISS